VIAVSTSRDTPWHQRVAGAGGVRAAARERRRHEGLEDQRSDRAGQPAEGHVRHRHEHDQAALDRLREIQRRRGLRHQQAGGLGCEQRVDPAQQGVAAAALSLAELREGDAPERADLCVVASRQQPLAVAFVEQGLLDVGQRRARLAAQHQQRRH
jgi:hypothetical protein